MHTREWAASKATDWRAIAEEVKRGDKQVQPEKQPL